MIASRTIDANRLRQEGEYAAVDEIVCEIETDKIVVEFRMPEAGTITKLGAQEGDTVEVGCHAVGRQTNTS